MSIFTLLRACWLISFLYITVLLLFNILHKLLTNRYKNSRILVVKSLPVAQLDSASDSDFEGEQAKTVNNRFCEAKSPKQGSGRAECTEAIGDDYATGRDEGSPCVFTVTFTFTYCHFYYFY